MMPFILSGWSGSRGGKLVSSCCCVCSSFSFSNSTFPCSRSISRSYCIAIIYCLIIAFKNSGVFILINYIVYLYFYILRPTHLSPFYLFLVKKKLQAIIFFYPNFVFKIKARMWLYHSHHSQQYSKI